MHRLALVAVLITGCSKSAGTTEKREEPNVKIDVPKVGEKAPEPQSTGNPADEKRFRLQPEEGSLAVEAPAGAKAGAEAVAKVVITPGAKYKVNTEYPTKLTLENADGVTIAKAELKAGGMDKQKGDADVFEESKLAFAVKLTPAKSGSYTINGSFKFAVCDKAGSTCLAKKEPIAIQVAAQ